MYDKETSLPFTINKKSSHLSHPPPLPLTLLFLSVVIIIKYFPLCIVDYKLVTSLTASVDTVL